MSNPTWPVYTFQINLETVQRYSWLLPYRTQLTGNETVTEADNMKNTRSTWLASLFPGTEFVAEKDAFQFTAYGQKALYYKNTYVSSPASADDVLKLVS